MKIKPKLYEIETAIVDAVILEIQSDINDTPGID